jgi:hypothetical protein
MGKDYGSYLSAQVSETPEQKLEVARLRECMRRRTQCTNVRLECTVAGGELLGGDVQLLHACPLKDPSGNTPMFVCVHCDITDEDAQLKYMAMATAAASSDDGDAGMTTAAASGPLASAAVSRRRGCRMRVRQILEDPSSRYKDDHMLILCQQHNYAAGMLFLLQKLGMNETKRYETRS